MKRAFSAIQGRELPLYLWAIGYLEFLWQTTLPAPPLGLFSWLFFLLLAGFVAGRRGGAWIEEAGTLARELKRRPLFLALFTSFGLSLALALFASLHPPHLFQEYDAINYQMGVPRQLLLRHSLRWIDWSVADLWPMALQWGMAPFSFAFGTIQKGPEFLLALGAGACLYRIAQQLRPELRGRPEAALPMLAFFVGHGVAIQLGTAMTDLPLLYFLLLALSALLEERYEMVALSLAVYTASKAFHPFQIAPVILGGLAWAFFGRSRFSLGILLRRFLAPFLVACTLLLARPVLVSMSATGTPLFPFAHCRLYAGSNCTAPLRSALDRAAADHLSTRTGYGEGDGPIAFARHLWRVAIPTQGVNNEFDYPLGLPWLLLMVLIAFSLARGAWRDPLLQLTFLFWALWWANAHQSRWLYPVLAFGFLATLSLQLRLPRLFAGWLLVSSVLSVISQARALRPTFSWSTAKILETERAKVRWRDARTLETTELLYVESPAPDHASAPSRWVLR